MHREALERLRDLLGEVEQRSDLAWWEWNIEHNQVMINDLKVTRLGYRVEDFQGRGFEAFTDLLPPDDRKRAMDAMREHLAGRASVYQVDYRILKADGDYTWFMDRGLTIARAADGRPLRLRGLVIDLGPVFERQAQHDAIVALVRQALPSSGSDREFVTLCSVCRRLKITASEWYSIDEDFPRAFPLEISHGLCPSCMTAMFPDDAESILAELEEGPQL